MADLPAVAAGAKATRAPHTICMADGDNVAIVANEGGLDAGTVLESGLRLVDRVPQGHKVALVPIGAGAAVVRYGIAIGHAAEPIAAGRWVHERLLKMPAARSLAGAGISQLDARMAQVRGERPNPDDQTRYGYIFGGGGSGTFAMILDPDGNPISGAPGPGSRICMWPVPSARTTECPGRRSWPRPLRRTVPTPWPARTVTGSMAWPSTSRPV